MDNLFENITKKLSVSNNLYDCIDLVSQYNGNEWKNYVSINPTKYNRNLVLRNEHIEIFVITWNTNQASKIHDHPEKGCILKVLLGEIHEKRYKKDNNKDNNKLIFTGETTFYENNIGFQIGSNELHKITNIT